MIVVELEGLDGAGKTTQAQMLETKLNMIGVPTYYLKFPQDPKLRELLMSKEYIANKMAAIFLIISEYIKVTSKFLEDHGDEDCILILDRYELSTKAYQSLGLEGEVKKTRLNIIESLMAWVPIRPNITIWFEIGIDDALSRIAKRSTSLDPYEKKEALVEVLVSYRQSMSHFQKIGTLCAVDATRNPNDVHHQVVTNLLMLYGGNIYQMSKLSKDSTSIAEPTDNSSNYNDDTLNEFLIKMVESLPEGE